jgi:hypothetical protein
MCLNKLGFRGDISFFKALLGLSLTELIKFNKKEKRGL